MRMIDNLFFRFQSLILRKFKRKYKIGQFQIILPAGHKLDIFKRKFSNYDAKLPIIAKFIAEKYETISIIDIGANIGDTATALRCEVDSAIVCVEGNPAFIPTLERNISALPGIIKVIDKFVGKEGEDRAGKIVTGNGTARIEFNVGEDQSPEIQFISYKNIMAAKNDLPQTKLIKIDTDGYDFKIIIDSIAEFKAEQAVIFFEFDPSCVDELNKNEWRDAIESLINAEFNLFIVYDNFGNYLVSFDACQIPMFENLVTFLFQSKKFGGGVYYYDIATFLENDRDIFEGLVNLEKSILIQA